MRSICVTVFLSLHFYFLSGQVAINTDGSIPNSSSLLDIKSTTKGTLLPRMTSVQRKAIISPVQGLLVFDTDKNSLFLFDGVVWQALFFMNPNSIPPIERKAGDDSIGTAFGTSVSISGDYAIIGAPYDEPGGSAYIFYRAGGSWIQQAKIVASDAENFESFGASVSISGDYVIVGATEDDIGINSFQGSAYVFVRSGTIWLQQAKLLASDGNANDKFGIVSISGSRAVVGAPGKEVASNEWQGIAYVFFRTGTVWTQQQRVSASDGNSNDRFGHAVFISGNNILIGAPGHLSERGAGYFFSYNTTFGWIPAGQIAAPGAINGDSFGWSVCISGNYAVIGAPLADIMSGGDEGAAYVFFFAGGIWTFQKKLTAIDHISRAEFGYSVSVDGDQLVIGAINGRLSGPFGPGYAYVYKRSGIQWNLVRKIVDPENSVYGELGNSCSISGMNMIVGADGGLGGYGKIFFLNID